MNTELIIFHRPNSGNINDSTTLGTASTDWAMRSGLNYGQELNPNKATTIDFQSIGSEHINANFGAKSGAGKRLDLYDDFDFPITYNITSVADPSSVKTAWSKNVSIPGTKNNNRIFSHIYHISGDGWLKIGNIETYINFNPNLRLEAVVLNDGLQILKGNLQLVSINKDSEGNISYEVALTGDLSSLFFDVGTTKLSDLDFTEWDHEWSRRNIMNSWDGSVLKNGLTYSNITQSTGVLVSKFSRDLPTGRLAIETTIDHYLQEGDYVKVGVIGWDPFINTQGTWTVTEVISPVKFTIGLQWPIILNSAWGYNATTQTIDIMAYNPPYGIGSIYKIVQKGEGYVYPLISWGDEIDYNSFPVTSMAPAYFVKEIWDKIFKANNSRYESDFINSDFFKRLILVQKKTTYDLTPKQVLDRGFFVGSTKEYTNQVNKFRQWIWLNSSTPSGGEHGTASFNISENPQSNIPSPFPFFIDGGAFSTTQSFYDGSTGDGLGQPGNWDSSTYKWEVKYAGEYKLDCNISTECWVDMTGGTASLIEPSLSYSQNETYLNGSVPNLGDALGVSFNPYCKVVMNMVRLRYGTRTETQIASNDFIMDNSFYTYKNYDGYDSDNPSNPFFGRYQPTSWYNKMLAGTYKGYFTLGEKVWIEIKYYVHSRTDQNGDATSFTYIHTEPDSGYGNVYTSELLKSNWYLRTRGLSSNNNVPSAGSVPVLYNTPSPISGENSLIYGSQFLPKDMTCADFLKNIIKTFNLYLEVDPDIEKYYHIEPRNDYYKTGSNGPDDYIDWTDKLDPDSVKLTPMGALLSKNYIFSNKKENDFWNARFLNERGRDYMSYTKSINNDFKKNDTKIECSFGSTVMISSPENSDVVIPAIYQRDATSGQIKPIQNGPARMLIWGGKRPYSREKGNGIVDLNNPILPNQSGWELISSSNVNNGLTSSQPLYAYPYAGTVDNPQDPYYDINWYNMEDGDFVYWNSARWSNHNLYNTYWKNFIDEVSDPSSILVQASFNLNPADIFKLDFSKIYVVDKVYYRLQKVIDYSAARYAMTKVELLKLKKPTKYIRKNLTSGGTFEQYVDLLHPITTTILEVGPRSKTWRQDSYTNNLPDLLSHGTLHINGLSNNVGYHTKNIRINGNECYIGNNSTNINIDGNGVNVAGGLENVNVFGTSNIKVEESNVTYINNIRYKEGVPISRCNVIDGGDEYYKSNSNTTITVLDGCEDNVLTEGSQGYENIINAGQNSILPDLPEIGYTTLNNPFPRTNFTGGADFISTTQSLIDVVRENKYNSSL